MGDMDAAYAAPILATLLAAACATFGWAIKIIHSRIDRNRDKVERMDSRASNNKQKVDQMYNSWLNETQVEQLFQDIREIKNDLKELRRRE